MAKSKAAKTPKAKTPKAPKAQPQELGLTGPGVEPIVIPEIDKAADAYAEARDERMAHSETENEKKKALMDVMHKHKDKLVKEEKGGWSYRYGEKLVTLTPHKESIKVKAIHEVSVTADEDPDAE